MTRPPSWFGQVRPAWYGGWPDRQCGPRRAWADLDPVKADGEGDGGEGEGDVLVVEDAAGDVAVDLEGAAVEGVVSVAGGGPAEGGQLGGQDPAAVRVPSQVRPGGAGWPGRGRRVGVEQE